MTPDKLDRLIRWHLAMAAEPKRNESKRRHHQETADALESLQAELEAAKADAERLAAANAELIGAAIYSDETLKNEARYQWLRDLKCNSFTLGRDDDHACNYVSAKEWIEEYGSEEDWRGVAPDDLQKMKDTNTIWALQIYPDTPIGSYTFHGATLDSAIDAAMSTTKEKP